MSLLLLLKGAGEAPESTEVAFEPDYRPPLELDVEIETAEGAIFRLSADDPKAENIPLVISFTTQRGDGFGSASFSLSRNILKDYPDINLLDTVRFVGRQGDIAYEGRVHSFPKANEPQHVINITCVGWMTYLKSKPCPALIIDRRLDWGEPTTARRRYVLKTLERMLEGSVSTGAVDSSSEYASGVTITNNRFSSSYESTGEAWKYFGGEVIGDILYDYKQLSKWSSPDTAWHNIVGAADDDVAEPGTLDLGTDHNRTNATGQSVTATTDTRKWAFIEARRAKTASSEDSPNSDAYTNVAVVGNHGLTLRGTSPEEGFYLTDIMNHIASTYYPKIDMSEVQDNSFVVQQYTKHDSPSDGHSIFQELNNYALWELNVWEDRKLHYGPADLSKYDWVLRTDDPGVSVNWQGDSIENFANGIVVTYNDFWGITRTLYPDDYEELRDPSEDNPASRHGEDLWTSVTVPWPCLEGEAVQFGRAYLGEFNRPRRPGSYRVSGGYLRDGAGHWRQGWAIRNSSTLGILDHPQDFPRLIFNTSWSQDGTALDIQVDGLPSTLDSIVARTQLLQQARGIA